MAQPDKLGMEKTERFKIHVPLGHAPEAQIIAMLNVPNRTFSEKVIEDMIRECGCVSSRASNFKAVARIRKLPFPWYCVSTDVIYPKPMSGHSLPFLMIVDSFSRSAICPAVKNLKPVRHVGILKVGLGRIQNSDPSLTLAEAIQKPASQRIIFY